jgi:hypothetical protein
LFLGPVALQWLCGFGKRKVVCGACDFGFWVPDQVHLVGVAISFEKNFYRLPFTPPSLVASSVLQVALVQSMGFNFLFVSHLLDEGFEVLFRPGGS